MYLVINTKLPSLNEYINKNRTNRYVGAKFIKDVEDIISIFIKSACKKNTLAPVTEYPVKICIEWHEATKRRDVDNIQSAQKYILDALQQNGILKGDGRKYVAQIYHTIIDSDTDKVIVKIGVD